MKNTSKNFEKFCKKFNQYSSDVLEPFYTFCVQNSLRTTVEMETSIRWIDKFRWNIEDITAERLLNFIKQRRERISKQKLEGKHQSQIDFSLYLIYAHDEHEAKAEWDRISESRRQHKKEYVKQNPNSIKSATLEYNIERYGLEEGTARYRNRIEKIKQKNPVNLEYWLNQGCAYEEAVANRSKRQRTFSLDVCIQKHGEVLGLEVFKKRQEKWLATLSAKPESERIIINLKRNNSSLTGIMLRGYSEQEALKMIEDRETKNKVYFSKESLEFFEKHFDTRGWKYGSEEWFIWDVDSNRHYFYDFTNMKSKIIVEYHGKAFHPNPRVLTSEEIEQWRKARGEVTGMEQLQFDDYKKKIAERSGFRVFEIYSNDTEETKANIIDQINDVLQNKDNAITA